MKKDKEWLESAIIKELMTNSGNPDMTTYEQGRVSALKYYLKLINQLDEPEVQVVPQFVADWIEEYKETYVFRDIVKEIEMVLVDLDVGDWIDNNYETFARAWLDGYTIEKEPEKLYRVKFPNVTKHGNEMYLEKNDGEDVTSIDWSTKDFVENEDSDDYLFTEQEIKAIDERYWAFAEEVTE